MIVATLTGALALCVLVAIALWWARRPVDQWGGR